MSMVLTQKTNMGFQAIQYIKPDFVNAMTISKQNNIYAYDAYFLDCAIRYKAPILTLDRKLEEVAQNLRVEFLEV